MHPVNCRCPVCLVDRSSFGTPEARAARESVSDERAARVMDRVRELDAETHNLARLRELESAATPGPWRVERNRHPETSGEDWGWLKGTAAHWCWTDRYPQQRRDAQLIAAMRNELPWLLEQAAENVRLRERLAKVAEIHRPIRVYDECEHDADHGCEPIEVYDYMACSESQIGWGCAVCCYDDEYPREDCPHGADHRGVAREQACPTTAALAEPDAAEGVDS